MSIRFTYLNNKTIQKQHGAVIITKDGGPLDAATVVSSDSVRDSLPDLYPGKWAYSYEDNDIRYYEFDNSVGNWKRSLLHYIPVNYGNANIFFTDDSSNYVEYTDKSGNIRCNVLVNVGNKLYKAYNGDGKVIGISDASVSGGVVGDSVIRLYGRGDAAVASYYFEKRLRYHDASFYTEKKTPLPYLSSHTSQLQKGFIITSGENFDTNLTNVNSDTTNKYPGKIDFSGSVPRACVYSCERHFPDFLSIGNHVESELKYVNLQPQIINDPAYSFAPSLKISTNLSSVETPAYTDTSLGREYPMSAVFKFISGTTEMDITNVDFNWVISGVDASNPYPEAVFTQSGAESLTATGKDVSLLVRNNTSANVIKVSLSATTSYYSTDKYVIEGTTVYNAEKVFTVNAQHPVTYRSMEVFDTKTPYIHVRLKFDGTEDASWFMGYYHDGDVGLKVTQNGFDYSNLYVDFMTYTSAEGNYINRSQSFDVLNNTASEEVLKYDASLSTFHETVSGGSEVVFRLTHIASDNEVLENGCSYIPYGVYGISTVMYNHTGTEDDRTMIKADNYTHQLDYDASLITVPEFVYYGNVGSYDISMNLHFDASNNNMRNDCAVNISSVTNPEYDTTVNAHTTNWKCFDSSFTCDAINSEADFRTKIQKSKSALPALVYLTGQPKIPAYLADPSVTVSSAYSLGSTNIFVAGTAVSDTSVTVTDLCRNRIIKNGDEGASGVVYDWNSGESHTMNSYPSALTYLDVSVYPYGSSASVAPGVKIHEGTNVIVSKSPQISVKPYEVKLHFKLPSLMLPNINYDVSVYADASAYDGTNIRITGNEGNNATEAAYYKWSGDSSISIVPQADIINGCAHAIVSTEVVSSSFSITVDASVLHGRKTYNVSANTGNLHFGNPFKTLEVSHSVNLSDGSIKSIASPLVVQNVTESPVFAVKYSLTDGTTWSSIQSSDVVLSIKDTASSESAGGVAYKDIALTEPIGDLRTYLASLGDTGTFYVSINSSAYLTDTTGNTGNTETHTFAFSLYPDDTSEDSTDTLEVKTSAEYCNEALGSYMDTTKRVISVAGGSANNVILKYTISGINLCSDYVRLFEADADDTTNLGTIISDYTVNSITTSADTNTTSQITFKITIPVTSEYFSSSRLKVFRVCYMKSATTHTDFQYSRVCYYASGTAVSADVVWKYKNDSNVYQYTAIDSANGDISSVSNILPVLAKAYSYENNSEYNALVWNCTDVVSVSGTTLSLKLTVDFGNCSASTAYTNQLTTTLTYALENPVVSFTYETAFVKGIKWTKVTPSLSSVGDGVSTLETTIRYRYKVDSTYYSYIIESTDGQVSSSWSAYKAYGSSFYFRSNSSTPTSVTSVPLMIDCTFYTDANVSVSKSISVTPDTYTLQLTEKSTNKILGNAYSVTDMFDVDVLNSNSESLKASFTTVQLASAVHYDSVSTGVTGSDLVSGFDCTLTLSTLAADNDHYVYAYFSGSILGLNGYSSSEKHSINNVNAVLTSVSVADADTQADGALTQKIYLKSQLEDPISYSLVGENLKYVYDKSKSGNTENFMKYAVGNNTAVALSGTVTSAPTSNASASVMGNITASSALGSTMTVGGSDVTIHFSLYNGYANVGGYTLVNKLRTPQNIALDDTYVLKNTTKNDVSMALTGSVSNLTNGDITSGGVTATVSPGGTVSGTYSASGIQNGKVIPTAKSFSADTNYSVVLSVNDTTGSASGVVNAIYMTDWATNFDIVNPIALNNSNTIGLVITDASYLNIPRIDVKGVKLNEVVDSGLFGTNPYSNSSVINVGGSNCFELVSDDTTNTYLRINSNSLSTQIADASSSKVSSVSMQLGTDTSHQHTFKMVDCSMQYDSMPVYNSASSIKIQSSHFYDYSNDVFNTYFSADSESDENLYNNLYSHHSVVRIYDVSNSVEYDSSYRTTKATSTSGAAYIKMYLNDVYPFGSHLVVSIQDKCNDVSVLQAGELYYPKLKLVNMYNVESDTATYFFNINTMEKSYVSLHTYTGGSRYWVESDYVYTPKDISCSQYSAFPVAVNSKYWNNGYTMTNTYWPYNDNSVYFYSSAVGGYINSSDASYSYCVRSYTQTQMAGDVYGSIQGMAVRHPGKYHLVLNSQIPELKDINNNAYSCTNYINVNVSKPMSVILDGGISFYKNTANTYSFVGQQVLYRKFALFNGGFYINNEISDIGNILEVDGSVNLNVYKYGNISFAFDTIKFYVDLTDYSSIANGTMIGIDTLYSCYDVDHTDTSVYSTHSQIYPSSIIRSQHETNVYEYVIENNSALFEYDFRDTSSYYINLKFNFIYYES